MPTHLPPVCALGAILPRNDPRDAIVFPQPSRHTETTLASLPADSIVGTSSVRRTAQLSRLHPHLKFQSVRGNIGTRLSKLDAEDSPYACLILAAAGLDRLGLGGRISKRLSVRGALEAGEGEREGMLHAVGQGGLGVEIREGDSRIQELVGKLSEKRSWLMGLAERSLMRTLEGGCSVPIGVETEWLEEPSEQPSPADNPTSEPSTKRLKKSPSSLTSSDTWSPGSGSYLKMRGIIVSVDGKENVQAERTERVDTDEEADMFGMMMAKQLADKGGKAILEKIELNRKIIEGEAGGA